MQRAAKPERTAPNALPCECMTPLGAPLLPEVNMMTSGSLGVTVAVMASTIRRGRVACAEALNLVERSKLRAVREVRLAGPRSKVVEIAVAAEFLDADQELHRRSAQLRDQFPRLQQRAQRDQHRADTGQRDRDLHPADAVGHDQPDPGALADAGFDERRGQIRCG